LIVVLLSPLFSVYIPNVYANPINLSALSPVNQRLNSSIEIEFA